MLVGVGVNAQKLASVTLSRSVNGGSFTQVRQAAYTYYEGTFIGEYSFGSEGDLRSAVIKDAGGTTIDTLVLPLLPRR